MFLALGSKCKSWKLCCTAVRSVWLVLFWMGMGLFSSTFSANGRSKRRVDGRDAVNSLEVFVCGTLVVFSKTWMSKVFLVVLWEEFQIISFSTWLGCQVSEPCPKWATGYKPIQLQLLPVFPDAMKWYICSGNWNGAWWSKWAAEVCLGKSNFNFIQAALMYPSTSGLHLKHQKENRDPVCTVSCQIIRKLYKIKHFTFCCLFWVRTCNKMK